MELPQPPEVFGVGCDIQAVRAVEQAWQAHGQRYLRKIMGHGELTSTGWDDDAALRPDSVFHPGAVFRPDAVLRSRAGEARSSRAEHPAPADCPTLPAFPEIAQRFAVKEAVAKALRVSSQESFPWSAIVIRDLDAPKAGWVPSQYHSGGGEPAVVPNTRRWSVKLTGPAARVAHGAVVRAWLAFSWNMHRDTNLYGCATVIALTGAKS